MIRRDVDPAELVRVALQLARKGKTEATRLAALAWLSSNGFVRPPELHGIVSANVAPIEAQRVLGLLSTEALRELEAASTPTPAPDAPDTEGDT